MCFGGNWFNGWNTRWGGGLGPFLLDFCVQSTAAFLASCSWQQVSSIPLELRGLEENGKDLAHLRGREREALGVWVFESSWHDWV